MKTQDFLATFIGDSARARLLRVCLFNESESFTILQASKRAGVSTTAAARALRELESMGILTKGKHVPVPTLQNGKLIKKVSTRKSDTVWSANPDFEHFRAVSNFVHEASPARYDTITNALKRTGRLGVVVLSGSFMGDPTRPADLILAADGINKQRLENALKGLEQSFGREIRYAAFTTPEFRYRLTIQDRLIRDTLDFPHLVLMDRTRLL
jgi:DNA-binding Lrp family transcriptional regulator